MQESIDGPKGLGGIQIIPELFEHVLLQLDLRTLLTSAGRVNSTWNIFIRDSPALQRALFFLIDDTHNLDGRPTRNPLLTTLFPTWFTGVDAARWNELPDLSEYDNQPFAANYDAFRRPEASWRNMLVQQRPAARTLGHWHMAASWIGQVVIEAKLSSYAKHGLRMGHVYRATGIQTVVHRPPKVFWGDSPTLGGNFKEVDDFAHFALVSSSERTPQPDLLKIAQEKRRFCDRADVILGSYIFTGWCGTEDDSQEREALEIKYSFGAEEGLEEADLETWTSQTVYFDDGDL